MAKAPKGYKGLPMEGVIARQDVRLRRTDSQQEENRRQAELLTAELLDGAAVLEVAPGPGYLAIEIARLGRFQVSGLDVSRTFVQIATENAQQAAVDIHLLQGNAADMPFTADSFDLIVCQAAFKNFSQPSKALNEMFRVLRPGGKAIIQDMRAEASTASIAEEVGRMQVGRFAALWARLARIGLRRRAYSQVQFERLAADSAFEGCEVQTGGIGIEVRLSKPIV